MSGNINVQGYLDTVNAPWGELFYKLVWHNIDCEACQVPLWDMFSTCVICAVVNEFDEIALIRQQYVAATKYVCVAGIIQLGENAEENNRL